MTSKEIRQKFLEYFEKHGHAVVPSSSLVPDDPSVLLTTAGMQQFKQYFTGELDAEKDFGSKNTVSVQKSFRTSDIDEVGDENHLTFFEMLGNFSFGGYFKEEAITYAYEFITKDMGLEIEYVTVFDPARVPDDDWRKGVPFDENSYDIWKNSIGIPETKIRREGVDNFWGPTGSEGPCGPTTEIYVNGVEVWNIVFNEFFCDKSKKLTPLKTPGVDTGMGMERLVMVVQGAPTIFETDLFAPIIALLPDEVPVRVKRILADHVRGIAFLIVDGVEPSNKEVGYILRRLMRRVVAHAEKYEVAVRPLFEEVVKLYHGVYSKLDINIILDIWNEEVKKFEKTLHQGLRALNKKKGKAQNEEELAQLAFSMYQSYGLPIEVSLETFHDWDISFDVTRVREVFDVIFGEHQNISRAGVEQKFGGHGLILNTGELKVSDEEGLKKVTRLHTATHLLHQAIRDVLGPEVQQMGSDITVERTRFDFSFDRKLSPEELQRIEDIVNGKIKEDLQVKYEEMSKEDAEKTSALHFFKEKYPDMVKVYYFGKDLKSAYSKEFCGGPHVEHTGEIGTFVIKKQESVGRSTKRIRATVV